MSFAVVIGFLGGTVFFQVGLCTPLRNMQKIFNISIILNATFNATI